MNDAELIALAALASIEAVQMDGQNQMCALIGELPRWTPESGKLPAGEALQEELYKRKLHP